ncbi:MAG: AraC family transcriptional regulator [Clostridia bacterium]|nr:AraC family transcriptional regulator [Clostridia bacterium]
MRDIALINRGMKDLNPLIIGEEHCEPGHRYGPAARRYTLIHFVVQGCGTFYRAGVNYTVHAGEAFLIRPDEVTTYQASETDPWFYQWVGFDGSLSRRFAELPPVFSYATNWAGEMLNTEADGILEYRIAAKLFELYAELFAGQKHKNHYVRRVKDYISALYMQPIHVEQIAEQMNLDRRYLSRLFKEKTGQTVQEYLISVRMEAAKRHLSRGASVAEAAQLCGYEDACNFSKMFKHLFGVSPGKWKTGK